MDPIIHTIKNTPVMTLILWRHFWLRIATCECVSHLVKYVYIIISKCVSYKVKEVEQSKGLFSPLSSDTPISTTPCPLWPETLQATKYMPVQCENIQTI